MKSILLVISGLPGVGKTTVGRLIAEQSQSFHLSVDPVHDALLSTGLADSWNVGVGAYESVRVMTEGNLLLGRCVVVDVVNDSEPARETWRTAARRTGSELVFVLLTCADEDEHRRRLEERERRARASTGANPGRSPEAQCRVPGVDRQPTGGRYFSHEPGRGFRSNRRVRGRVQVQR